MKGVMVSVVPEIDLTAGADDPVQADPEVRQARSTAQAARSRLTACVIGPRVDLAEAQRMLDALRLAETLAADAEDRVLVRHGLLTRTEADRRAAARRPAPPAPVVTRAEPAAPGEPAAPAKPAAPAEERAQSSGGALVIPFRRVQLPVPALPVLSALPADSRRTVARAARVLLPLAAASLAGAVLANRLRRPSTRYALATERVDRASSDS